MMLMQQSWRRKLRENVGQRLQSVAYATGAMRCSNWLWGGGRGGVVVLMYHSVAEGDARKFIDPRNHVPAAVFEEQVKFLSKHRTVIELSQMLNLLRSGEAPVPDTAVITFDDGYFDNLTIAAPILERYRLPATLFLATGYVDRSEAQWVDQAYTMFERRSAATINWNSGRGDHQFDLDNRADYLQAYWTVRTSLLTASADERRSMLNKLSDGLRPTTRPPKLTMSWDDVRTLVSKHPRFEIGGHTTEHLDLTQASIEQARSELHNCMHRIQEQTGHPPRHFSFPYGRTSAALRNIVAAAGFASACSDGEGVVCLTTNRYAIPRVEAPAAMRRFDVLTSTTNKGFWRKLA